jgi:hypothetical protein
MRSQPLPISIAPIDLAKVRLKLRRVFTIQDDHLHNLWRLRPAVAVLKPLFGQGRRVAVPVMRYRFAQGIRPTCLILTFSTKHPFQVCRSCHTAAKRGARTVASPAPRPQAPGTRNQLFDPQVNLRSTWR